MFIFAVILKILNICGCFLRIFNRTLEHVTDHYIFVMIGQVAAKNHGFWWAKQAH